MEVQLFGLRSSSATRAAERFFKERQVKIHFVDLNVRAIARGELNYFIQKVGLNALLDTTGKAYHEAGLEWLRVSDDGMIARVAEEPRLLNLPLVRFGKFVTVGEDVETWRSWLLVTK